MGVLTISVTEPGRLLAERLPWEHAHGDAAATVRSRWATVDGLVLCMATGAAVRIVAPLLADKHTDPAVVCVDDAGRWAVALTGGHHGANDLAREVAALLGAQAVVTTATDARGVAGLDDLPGLVAEGDVAGVTGAILAGRPPAVGSDLPGWAPPPGLAAGGGPERVVLTDGAGPSEPGLVRLRPPSLVVGVGTATDAAAEEVEGLLAETLRVHGLSPDSVGLVATVDRRAAHPAVTALGRPVRAYSSEELAAVAVPHPSEVVAAAVGTPSVAEAAALLAAGPGATLVAPKRTSPRATVAVARRSGPAGVLRVVGLGPGRAGMRTPDAAAAVRSAEVVVGYGPYVDQAGDLLRPGQDVRRSPIGAEADRAAEALREAAAGRSVALVCSGDAGVYAMASLVVERAGELAPSVEVLVVPGVTAALAAAAALGAPLGHDHAVISLSDLLTPWEVIERRVRAAADADLVVALYNPRSRGRDWQLPAAMEVLSGARPPATPIGVVTDVGRPGQRVEMTSIAAFDPAVVGMTTCVIVGSSTTRVVAGRMVTPRGYRP